MRRVVIRLEWVDCGQVQATMHHFGGPEDKIAYTAQGARRDQGDFVHQTLPPDEESEARVAALRGSRDVCGR